VLVSIASSRDRLATVRERQHLQLNEPVFKPRMAFAHLAQHFMTHELGEQPETADPKSHTTIAGYKRILKNRCIDRWGKRTALSLEPLEIEQWLKALKRDEGLANPTLDKIRRVMSLVFKHGQRHGLIPRNQESNPMRFVRCKTTSSYEAMILTPKQAFDVLMHLQEPERTLTLLASATGLRISEMPGPAMAGRGLRAIEDSCASHLDVWESRFAEEQGFARPCAASFATC
jgi:hypothetical protein